MTDVAAPRAGAGDEDRQHGPRFQTELFRDGNALILHERGLVCRSIARHVVTQCETYDVDAESCPIDDANPNKLFKYNLLFFVAPLPAGARADAVTFAAMEQAMAAYREFRPHGLKSVLAGEVDWRHAGPVQLLLWGTPADEAPDLGNLVHACVIRQITDVSSLGNLFGVYLDTTAEEDEHERMVAKGIAAWRYVQTWGLPGVEHVRPVLDIIENQIEFYNDERHHANYRPHPKYLLNRLQLVLANPHLEIRNEDLPEYLQNRHEMLKACKKRFKESGALVTRNAIIQIRVEYPMLHRPGDREKKKDLQVDFQKLYEALLLLNGLPAEVVDHVRHS